MSSVLSAPNLIIVSDDDDEVEYETALPNTWRPLRVDDVMLAVAHTEDQRKNMKNQALLSVLDHADFAERQRTQVLKTNVHTADILLLVCVTREKDLDEQERGADATIAECIGVAANDARLLADGGRETHLECVAAYERKTVNDLVQSIIERKDVGMQVMRWHDQKVRMQRLCRATGAQPHLLLEKFCVPNELDEWRKVMKEESIHKILQKCRFRDGIQIVQVETSADTALHLLLDAKFVRDEHVRSRGWTRLGLPDERMAFSVRKSDRDTPESWFVGALTMVARVTESLATDIMQLFRTPRHLIAAYEQCADERERNAMLAPVQVTGAGKRKNLGPAASKAIRERFFPDVDGDLHDEAKEARERLAPATKKRKTSAPKKKKSKSIYPSDNEESASGDK